jgi:hypothetical protein
MNTNLLKEAIAEADAIKKMAIENAKSSLNEAFDSKIKSMMAARLEEEADDLELEEEYEEGYDEKDEAKHAEPDADNKGGKSDEDEDNMEEEYGKEEEADEAFNLDAILAELEAGEVEEGDEVMEEEAEEDEAEEEMPKKKKEEEPAEEEGDEEEEMDEEIDIAALLAEMEDGEEDEMEKDEMKEGEMKDEEDKDEVATLEEEMMSLLEKMKQAKAAKEKKEEPKESEELQEIKRQAAELAQKVNETNLINAKLLYLNKILRKYNLSEQQKIKVISAFDKAETVNESKIVHESLDQAFSVKNDNVKSGLKESIGFASSAAGTSTKRVINEGVVGDVDKQVSRWQKLAGIIK